MTGYVLCTAPRSGSTMLGRMLAAAGAGRPESWTYEPSVAAWAARVGSAPEAGAVLAAVRAAGTAGGVFGLRLQGGSREHLMRVLADRDPEAVGDRARLEAAFGPLAFVHLRREDLVAGAVSRLRAEGSGLWHRGADGRPLERLAPRAPDGYDCAAIARHVAELTRLHADWEAWFAREGIAPLRLTYEALAADPAGAARRLLRALGLPAHRVRAPDTVRLADGTSAAWIARFRAEGAS